jgi:hypothetical protein
MVLVVVSACQNPAPSRREYTLEWVGQAEGNWCWAATAAMVGQAYTGAQLDECSIVSTVLDRDCCANRDSCNETNVASKALTMAYGLRTEERPFDLAAIGIAPVIVAYFAPGSSVGHATVVRRMESGEFLRFDPIKPSPYNVQRLSAEQVSVYGDGWVPAAMVVVLP